MSKTVVSKKGGRLLIEEKVYAFSEILNPREPNIFLDRWENAAKKSNGFL